MSSYGSESMGEVSKGTASTAFTGHQSQPGDAARQPLAVNDSGGGGGGSRVSRGSRPFRASRPSRASHFTRLPCMGIPPWMWKWGRPWPAPSAPRPCRTQGAFPSRVSLACPGPSLLSRESGQPRDSPAPLWGPGNFQGRGNRQPSGRHRPSTVNDTALSGHSALPGQSSHSDAIHGDTPLEVEMGPALACPLAHRPCRTN